MHLPLLSLESIRPRWSEPGSHVIVERECVLAVSDFAAAAGVRVGMRRAGVSMLAPDAVLHERSTVLEQEALDSVTLAMLQFTPEVAHTEENSVVLDVSASLRVFGGPPALARRVRTSIDALGLTCRIGAGPTAQGAWLMARHAGAGRRRVCGMPALARTLDALPFVVLPPARPYQEWLAGIGCQTLGDLGRLPRAGLQRRASKDLLQALDRAYGRAPELYNWIKLAPAFRARLELPDRIEHAEAVLFGARHLLIQLCGWLVAQQLALSRFILSLIHERGRCAVPPTPVEISLGEPAWHEEHLVRLLRERLGRLQLTAPVIGLELEAQSLEPMLPPSATLFPEPGGTPADFRRLLELLTARLGADAILTPAPQDDHRPEICNAWQTAQGAKRPCFVLPENTVRPFWLLEQAIPLLLRDHRPFYGSPLRLISAPERIEGGWWDGVFVVRDYFIAQGEEAACYWIYRERTGDDAQWFLHGLFA